MRLHRRSTPLGRQTPVSADKLKGYQYYMLIGCWVQFNWLLVPSKWMGSYVNVSFPAEQPEQAGGHALGAVNCRFASRDDAAHAVHAHQRPTLVHNPGSP